MDFSALAGLFNVQCDIFRPAEVVASECFDKEGLIRAHVVFARRLSPQDRHFHLTPAYSTIVEPCLPSAALHSLQRISITELKESCHPAAGRVLIGELCVDATLLVSINTIIADINFPDKAARLHIYNVVSPSEKLSRAQRMYPKGMRLAVKEPYFKRCKDGALAIRVNNPADLVEISPDSDAAGPAGDPCSSKLASARASRERGNELFKMQDWKAAADKYSNAISAALLALSSCSRNKSVEGDTSIHNHSCSPKCVELLKGELVMAYSNRSEVRIRLNHFERAVADASKALRIEPTHLKSTFRKGVALLSLHSYNEALIFLQKALQMDPSNRDLKAAVQQGKDCVKQSSSGQGYNLSLLFEQEAKNDRKGFNSVPSPACAEFIGPVEIRLISDASKYGGTLQRGIFTTKNAKCGELLLVSIAVAFSMGETNRRSAAFIVTENDGMIAPLEAEDLIAELLGRARNSSRVRQQLSSLASEKTVGNDLDVPEMGLFIPNSISAKECLDQEEKLTTLDAVGVDVVRMRAIAKTNAFTCSASSGQGVWCLPSFINHSCIPTASCVIVGNAMFVRAARDLSAGEEVTISYLDVFRPVKIRQKQSIRGWGFECRCKRCMWEEDMMSSKQHYAYTLECLARKYEELKLQSTHHDVCSFTDLANISAQVEQVLQENCEVISTCGTSTANVKVEEWKGWLRSSFAYSYWCALNMMNLGVKSGNEMQYPSVEEMVASIRQTVPGSESMLLDLGLDLDLKEEQRRHGLQQELMQMGVALYGRRFSPSALATLLAIRKKTKMK